MHGATPLPPLPLVLPPGQTPSADVLLRIVQEERTHQAGELDSLNFAAAALLALEGVLISQLLDWSWAELLLQIGSIIVFSLSMLALLACLWTLPVTIALIKNRKQWWKWRKESKGAIAGMKPEKLQGYLPIPLEKTTLEMYRAGALMIANNYRWLLAPKRVTLRFAVLALIFSFALMGADELSHLEDHPNAPTPTPTVTARVTATVTARVTATAAPTEDPER
ncbi:hypothetical protein [Kitasatospora kazusensis]|uniref:hypothetical protein n=1 Tax=Kitasatospora kazusensis TaxID=407974 RepID=UPI0031E2BFDE